MGASERSRTLYQPAELGRGSAEVTCRGGESLVPMPASADRARTALPEPAVQLVAVSTDPEGTPVGRKAVRYPCMPALGPSDQDTRARDVLTAARASRVTNESHRPVAEPTSRHEAASASAAGLGKARVEWLEDAETIGRP